MPTSGNNGIKAVVFLAQDVLKEELHLPHIEKNEDTESLSSMGDDTKGLNDLSAQGQSGLLHLRRPLGDHKDDTWLLRQILGLFDEKNENVEKAKKDGDQKSTTLAAATPQGDDESLINQRHHGMKFSIWSDDDKVIQFIRQEMRHTHCRSYSGEANDITREEICQQLDNTHTDVLLVHWGSKSNEQDRINVIQRMNTLMHDLLQEDSSQHAYKIHITAMASHPQRPLQDVDEKPHTSDRHESSAFVPMQSYEIYRGQRVNNVDHIPRIMFSSYLDGVTRKDHNMHFTERSCSKHCGLGTILADHFFDELSYTVGYSPKYGA